MLYRTSRCFVPVNSSISVLDKSDSVEVVTKHMDIVIAQFLKALSNNEDFAMEILERSD